jgi:putative transposase
MTYLAHKIELDPTIKQKEYFAKAVGTARYAFNWGLEEWKRQVEEGLTPSAYALQRQFNALKGTEIPWVYEVSKTAPKAALENLGMAFKRFSKKLAKVPKFKKKWTHDSYRMDNGEGIGITESHVTVPRLGPVKLKESLRYTGKIISAVISRDGAKWFISITVDTIVKPMDHKSKVVLGVDLGIKEMATCSDGTVYKAPRPLKRYLKKLKRLQRAVSRRVAGSGNKRKAAARVKALYTRIKNIRKDAIHKMTTTMVRNNHEIVIEDLNVGGMTKIRTLAKAISDIGFHEVRRQLEYKCPMNERILTIADRWFPSSKRCHVCGTIKATLSRSERTYTCGHCGLSINRDLNAALNLSTVSHRPELTPAESGSSLGV